MEEREKKSTGGSAEDAGTTDKSRKEIEKKMDKREGIFVKKDINLTSLISIALLLVSVISGFVILKVNVESNDERIKHLEQTKLEKVIFEEHRKIFDENRLVLRGDIAEIRRLLEEQNKVLTSLLIKVSAKDGITKIQTKEQNP